MAGVDVRFLSVVDVEDLRALGKKGGDEGNVWEFGRGRDDDGRGRFVRLYLC